MAHFVYKVKDSEGKTQKGTVEALNIKIAINLLHERGFFIIELKEAFSAISIQFGGAKISYSDLVHITRQLSTMITAGLTLVEALGILRQQVSKKPLIKLIFEIEEGVKVEGKSMFEVLAKHPKVFSPLYLALVRAGEASGKLDPILSRLADNLEKLRDFRNKVKGALIYPSIVVTGMVTVSFIVMTVVVPRLTSLYKEFDVDLPLPTQILIAISSFLTHFWWLFILMVVGGVIFFLRFRQTQFGKHLLTSIVLKLPVFGSLIVNSVLTEITRTLSILIESGVPILTSLEIIQEATSNILYKETFIEAAKKVEKGYPLSDPLSESELFPPILGQMVAIGERTGKLGESLLKLSKYFETEADMTVHSLTTMVEPLIMIILGLGVGFLVMAVLLPIYTLTSQF